MEIIVIENGLTFFIFMAHWGNLGLTRAHFNRTQFNHPPIWVWVLCAISGEIFAFEKLLICGFDRIEMKELRWESVGWYTKKCVYHKPLGSLKVRVYKLNKRPLIEQLNRICCEIHSQTRTPLICQSIMAVSVCLYCISNHFRTLTTRYEFQLQHNSIALLLMKFAYNKAPSRSLHPLFLCAGSELMAKRFSINWVYCYLFRYLNLCSLFVASSFSIVTWQ